MRLVTRVITGGRRSKLIATETYAVPSSSSSRGFKRLTFHPSSNIFTASSSGKAIAKLRSPLRLYCPSSPEKLRNRMRTPSSFLVGIRLAITLTHFLSVVYVVPSVRGFRQFSRQDRKSTRLNSSHVS